MNKAKEFVLFVVKNMVADVEDVEVTCYIDEREPKNKVCVMLLKVTKRDAGKVIGRKGRNIEFLRNLTRAVLAKEGFYGLSLFVKEKGESENGNHKESQIEKEAIKSEEEIIAQ